MRGVEIICLLNIKEFPNLLENIENFLLRNFFSRWKFLIKKFCAVKKLKLIQRKFEIKGHVREK